MDVTAVVQEWNKRHLEVPRNEVSLFRLLGTILEEMGPCTYVEELHGHRGQVKFESSIWPGNIIQREICDLAILVIDPLRGEARVTFHQNKYQRGSGSARCVPDFRFKANIHQYDLLAYRPTINSVGTVFLPSEVLSSTEYNSVGSYGVFFENTSHLLDYAYSTAKWLVPESYKIETKLLLSNSLVNITHADRELLATLGLASFIEGLFGMQIGAPLQKGSDLADYIAGLLQRALNQDTDSRQIYNALELVGSNAKMYEGDFRLLILSTSRDWRTRE